MTDELGLIPGDEYQGVIQNFTADVRARDGKTYVRLRARVQSHRGKASVPPRRDLAATLVMDTEPGAALDLARQLVSLAKRMDWRLP